MAERGLLTDDPARAAAALRDGGLAVIPTETVYGLAARASDRHAVARVYATKERPADHPLIVHLPDVAHLDAWAASVPGYAARLVRRYWPGPLTVVLPRGARAGLHLTGGQQTVGLRVPDHPLTATVLAMLDDGVAAPSANLFGRVSPTRPEHVLSELGDRLVPGRDVVLDGGPCRVGVESSIVDCTGEAPRILRPGGVSTAEVEQTGGVAVDETPSPVRAPGTLASHYAPLARVRVVAAADLASAAEGGDSSVGVLAPADVATPSGLVRLAAPATPEDYASGLYAALREADALALASVLAVAPLGAGMAAAVRDRLARAATR